MIDIAQAQQVAIASGFVANDTAASWPTKYMNNEALCKGLVAIGVAAEVVPLSDAMSAERTSSKFTCVKVGDRFATYMARGWEGGVRGEWEDDLVQVDLACILIFLAM